MEAAVIAALVAGTVTLIGVAVNLYIAKRATHAAASLAVLQKQLDDGYRSATQVRELEAETERLRIAGWHLIGVLSRIEHRESGQSVELVRTSADLLVTRAQNFLDGWARVKPELPEDLRDYPAMLRHECRARLDNVITSVLVLTEIIKKKRPNRGELENLVKKISHELTELLKSLDVFGQTLSTIRRFGGDDPEIRRLTPAAPDGRARIGAAAGEP